MEITAVKTMSDDTPREPIVIEKVRVHAVGDPPPLPEPVRYTPPATEPLRPKPQPVQP